MFNRNIKVDPALVRELVELLNETGLTEIEVQSGGQRIRVSRGATGAVSAAAIPAAAPPRSTTPVPAAEIDFSSHPGAVLSPMVGTAYRSPEPGARPFAEVGDVVKAGQTLLIVEAMKTMNTIPAPKAGKVTQVLFDDAQPVEYGQPLVVVE